jgi:hypothetical protein
VLLNCLIAHRGVSFLVLDHTYIIPISYIRYSALEGHPRLVARQKPLLLLLTIIARDCCFAWHCLCTFCWLHWSLALPLALLRTILHIPPTPRPHTPYALPQTETKALNSRSLSSASRKRTTKNGGPFPKRVTTSPRAQINHLPPIRRSIFFLSPLLDRLCIPITRWPTQE